MQEVEFYALSRPLQDRFVASARGADAPRPIAVKLGAHKGSLGWAIPLSLAAAIGIAVLYRRGFGALGDPFAVQSMPLLGAYVALFVAVFVGLLQLAAFNFYRRSLPYSPGVYLFATSVIDARAHVLRVFPVDEGEETFGDGKVRFTFGSERFEFPASDDPKQEIDRAKKTLDDVKDAPASRASSARVTLDPLFEPRMSSPLAPQKPLTRSVPIVVRGRLVVALLIGAACGFGVFRVRNAASDDRMFVTAKSRDDAPSYRAYLTNGVRHKNEVSGLLLPRAELREAEKVGTVAAIQAYIAAHPGSAIEDEVSTSLHAAMLAELEGARKAGTLAALRAFVERHPDHHVDAELKGAMHDVFTAALTKVLDAVPDKNGEAEQLVRRLFAFAEKTPEVVDVVEVSFRRVASKTLKGADKILAKNSAFNGETSYPSRYFDDAHDARHEPAFGKAVESYFSALFSSEVFSFADGPLIADDAAEVPPVTKPTIVIAHREEWSGTATVSKTPRGIFVGMTYLFDLAFVVPGDPKPHRFKLTIMRGPSLTLLKELAKQPPSDTPPEEPVYDEMTTAAYDQVRAKYLAVFGAKP